MLKAHNHIFNENEQISWINIGKSLGCLWWSWEIEIQFFWLYNWTEKISNIILGISLKHKFRNNHWTL